jgi:hypothetical protein
MCNYVDFFCLELTPKRGTMKIKGKEEDCAVEGTKCDR